MSFSQTTQFHEISSSLKRSCTDTNTTGLTGLSVVLATLYLHSRYKPLKKAVAVNIYTSHDIICIVNIKSIINKYDNSSLEEASLLIININ